MRSSLHALSVFIVLLPGVASLQGVQASGDERIDSARKAIFQYVAQANEFEGASLLSRLKGLSLPPEFREELRTLAEEGGETLAWTAIDLLVRAGEGEPFEERLRHAIEKEELRQGSKELVFWSYLRLHPGETRTLLENRRFFSGNKYAKARLLLQCAELPAAAAWEAAKWASQESHPFHRAVAVDLLQAADVQGPQQQAERLGLLEQLLADNDYEVRQNAIRACPDLGEIGRQALEQLEPPAAGVEAVVYWSARYGCGEREESLDRLRGMFQEGTEAEKAACLSVTGAYEIHELYPFVPGLATHETTVIRVGVAETLGRIGGRDAIETLAGLLVDADELVRTRATESFGLLGFPETIGYVRDRLQDEPVRAQAYCALARIGTQEAIRLVAAVRQLDSYYALTVIAGLFASRSESAIQLLRELLAMEQPEVRLEVYRVLGSCGRRGLPVLERGLKEEDPKQRAWAASSTLQILLEERK